MRGRRAIAAARRTEEAPAMSVEFLNPAGLSRGTYSHVAVVTGGRTVHVSGQVAYDEQGRVVGATFEAQAEQVFENLKRALAGAGAELRHVVKMNTYVRDLTGARLRAFREIRTKHMGAHQPASTLVGTPALVHEDLMLEVEVVAVVD
jgi:enamine deaminase RidA (YjgF/YER057c/UK114 family)